MEPIEYVRALIRRWPIIAIGALIGAAFAFLGTDPEPEPVQSTYTATHTLLVTEGQTQFGGQPLVGTVTFAQVPVFATTGEVPRLVAEELGYDGAPGVARRPAHRRGGRRDRHAALHDRAGGPRGRRAHRRRLRRRDGPLPRRCGRRSCTRPGRPTSLEDVEQLEAEIRELDQQIADQLAAAERRPRSRAIRSPRPTRSPGPAATRRSASTRRPTRRTGRSSPRTPATLNLTTLERAQPVQVQTGGFTPPRTRSTRVPIGAGIGALLGAGVALLAERLDAKIRDRRKAEEAFGASVVAELPTLTRKQRAARLVVGPEEHNAAAEAFRSLRTSITFMAAGGQPLADDDRVGAILVTSPSPAEGKTTIAVNLAAAFAETGRSVVARQRRLPPSARLEDPHRRAAAVAGGPRRHRPARPVRVPRRRRRSRVSRCSTSRRSAGRRAISPGRRSAW